MSLSIGAAPIGPSGSRQLLHERGHAADHRRAGRAGQRQRSGRSRADGGARPRPAARHAVEVHVRTARSRYKPALNFNGADTFVYRVAAGADAVGRHDRHDHRRGGERCAGGGVTTSIATTSSQTLNVAAPGVLANDTDVEGDALTAVLVTKTRSRQADVPGGRLVHLHVERDVRWLRQLHLQGVRRPEEVEHRRRCTSPGYGQSRVRRAARLPTRLPAGTTLIVAAPGVLINDLDPDGESVTAVLVTPPAHGTLALNADGSFVYTPAAQDSRDSTRSSTARWTRYRS